MSARGEIRLLLGPMFARKSTEMLLMVDRYRIAKKKVFLIKFARDTRYDSKDEIVTHDQLKKEAHPCDKLSDLAKNPELQEAQVVGIDEGQFFPDIAEFCEEQANLGKIVIVAALDGNFRREPFGEIYKLIPLCEEVRKLNAVCMNCHDSDAHFSKKIYFENQNTSTDIDIGGEEKYMAVCRGCYFV